jgi:hypothetical protein
MVIPGIAPGEAFFVSLVPGATIFMPGIEPRDAGDMALAFCWLRPSVIAIPGMGLAGRRNARRRFGAFCGSFAVGIVIPGMGLAGGRNARRRFGAAGFWGSLDIGIFIPGMDPISFWATAGVETRTASRKARAIFIAGPWNTVG